MKFDNLTEAQLAALDASLVGREGPWWDTFYGDRAKSCPFFGPEPDESLAQWLREGRIGAGRALDLGCGNGRNAIHLARNGFAVEAVDFSPAAVAWANERAKAAGVAVSISCRNVLDLALAPDIYDVIYDSGCFHHIAPHRRSTYAKLVVRALKPGGWLGLTCFRPESGSRYTDDDVYERRSLGGGLGYTERQLRQIWSNGLEIRILRPMEKPGPGSGLFGEPFLWVVLAQRT